MKKHNSRLYRSGLESKIAEELKLAKAVYSYEPKDGKIEYTVPESYHKYTPDFVINNPSGKQIIVETKGLWNSEDRYKHLLIRQQHPDLDIRFVFTRSKSRIRKGSKTTYEDICNGLGRGPYKGIRWLFADKVVPSEWLKEE